MEKKYAIGDTGPAGGIVFYDRRFQKDGGWQYLEVAPAKTEFTAQWGADTEVNGTETKVGSGKQNTQLIVKISKNKNAAQLCVELDFNGQKDWFLPSKDELDLIYKNLKQNGLGGFKKAKYWSSSQNDTSYLDDAWYQDFNDGNQSCSVKDTVCSVRAIRAF